MPSLELYFEEPRLRFSFAGKFLFKLAVYLSYAVLSATALVFLLSESFFLKGLGVLIFLFLFDRLWHVNQADKSLDENLQGKINAAEYLSPRSLAVFDSVFRKASVLGGDFLLLFFLNLLSRSDSKEALKRLEVSADELMQKTRERLEQLRDIVPDKEEILGKISVTAVKAFELALESDEKFVEPRNIFAAVGFSGHKTISSLFNLFAISAEDIEKAVIFSRYKKVFLKNSPSFLAGFSRRRKLKHRVMNRAWTARPTPLLDKYSSDLTDLARIGQTGFLVGHKQEFEQLLSALSMGESNVILVGEPGSGKSTLVENLAGRIVKDQVSQNLYDRRVVSLSLSSLAISADPGELVSNLRKILDEILTAKNIILFIPDMDNLVKTSGGRFLSAADVLLPVIKTSPFPIIGATYPREFKQFIEPQSDFFGSFEVIRVKEISEEEAVKLLVYESVILESTSKVFITFGAVKKAVELAHRYLHSKPLPNSASELLKDAAADVQAQSPGGILDAEKIIKMVEKRVDIPLQAAGREERESLLNLEKLIHQRLIDQEEAVRAVSRSLREYRSGLARRGGPIAAFLFVGPTGVGKTELAKILSRIQFGSEKAMIRFDMSEYQTRQSIYRFLGSPTGEASGTLAEAVRQKPYSLVLLDEFEKAHPDILNLFLQVFDDGRLTDNLGREVNFQNTIIICTSNAHSDLIKNGLEQGKKIEEIAAELKMRLTDFFKAELINRFSDIIVFKSLGFEEILRIAEIQLCDLSSLIKESHGIELVFDQSAVRQIAIIGHDPVFGARPLRKAISENVRGVLADKILRKEIDRGNKVEVVFENGAFDFRAS